MAIYDNRGLMMAAYIVVAIGAVNWGLVAFADFNLITDGLSMATGSTGYQGVIGLIAGAGVLNLYEIVQEEI